MNAISRYSNKLWRRREQIELTLEHLKNERRGVEENIEWMDRAAYQGRINSFARLDNWYHDKTEQIEKAFERIKNGTYGRCVACHKPIESQRLELCPETESCFDCQEFRERVRTD